jgi:hypothetical protein
MLAAGRYPASFIWRIGNDRFSGDALVSTRGPLKAVLLPHSPEAIMARPHNFYIAYPLMSSFSPLAPSLRSMYIAFGKRHPSLCACHSHKATRLAARRFVLAGLEQAVQTGYLEIEECSRVYQFGSCKQDACLVRVTVVNDSFWPQMFL